MPVLMTPSEPVMYNLQRVGPGETVEVPDRLVEPLRASGWRVAESETDTEVTNSRGVEPDALNEGSEEGNV